MTKSIIKINIIAYDEFVVTDDDGNLITGLVDGDFTKYLYNPDGDLVSVSGGVDVTVTELGNGIYRIDFTPDALGEWVLLITNSTYFPYGKSANYLCVENLNDDLDTTLDSIKDQTDKLQFASGNDLIATIQDEEVNIGKVKGVGVSGIDDFKNEMNETELHNGLDSYSNKDDWKANKNEIADQVWDESISDHLGGDKAGQHLEDANAVADPDAVAQAVWDYLVAGSGSDSFGEVIRRIAGMTQENYRLLNPSYDSNNNLLSATIKIYPSALDTNNNTNPLATYSVVATYNASGVMTSYKVTKA